MPDYSKGKIYVIRSHQTEDIYIGSTIQSLSSRLGSHNCYYKKYLINNIFYKSSFEILKYDDYYIELMELFPCSSNEELHRREGEIIRLHNCVNKQIAGRTRKEYYEDNKEKKLKMAKKYRKENQDTIKQYREENKEKIKETQRKYKEINKEKLKKQNKEYREKCKLNSIALMLPVQPCL